MKTKTGRRSFLKKIGISGIAVAAAPVTLIQAGTLSKNSNETVSIKNQSEKRIYNGAYRDEYLSRVAFPIGGIGAGMFCLEGTGAGFSLHRGGSIYDLRFTIQCRLPKHWCRLSLPAGRQGPSLKVTIHAPSKEVRLSGVEG